MYRSLITVRYAKALFLQAEEEGKTEAVLQDARNIMRLFDENPELKKAILHPAIKGSQKREVIDQVFHDQVTPVMFQFLHLLLKNKREFYINDIFRNFRDQFNESRGIKWVELTTALKIEDREKDSIKKLIRESFGAQKVDFEEKLDPEIVGGFIVQIGDQLLDASVRRQLEMIRKTLLNHNYSIN